MLLGKKDINKRHRRPLPCDVVVAVAIGLLWLARSEAVLKARWHCGFGQTTVPRRVVDDDRFPLCDFDHLVQCPPLSVARHCVDGSNELARENSTALGLPVDVVVEGPFSFVDPDVRVVILVLGGVGRSGVCRTLLGSIPSRESGSTVG